ncbi:SDR family oxidoreductase [Ruegeria arenilitoris]|uniref:SDR family oxidoreductase n=1 Tax=Ruegeria arenilitoris TaxID=1173585 RepID=UPI001480193C|nr:SDR family NAD(P)-dependent oxidoreductase [Ruegeria arenilitoris]
MKLSGKTVVVTGAASGIGKSLAQRFSSDGAKVVCADIDEPGAHSLASEIGGHAFFCDVSNESSISDLIEATEDQVGTIDLFCGNAGVLTLGGVDVPDDEWDRIWKINVMSHVWTARHLIPRMTARGSGYILITASAAGLLNQPGAAPYAVTKHAAIGFAEWVALTYRDQGIRVSVLCPQAVRTDMIRGHEDSVAAIDGILEPQEVASACVEAITEERFLVLPHEQVMDYFQFKAVNYDRWIDGMSKINQKFNR